jgi:hypothetical protein
MNKLANLYKETFGVDISNMPGAGAAGMKKKKQRGEEIKEQKQKDNKTEKYNEQHGKLI